MQVLRDINKTISQIVRDDYRTSDVFKKYGFNYCCGGNLLLPEACAERNIDYTTVLNELNNATRNIHISNALQFSEWKLEFLVDYILNVHHAYLRMAMPSLEASLVSFIESHKQKVPELYKVHPLFRELSALLEKHSHHEEEIIFPYIKQIENAHRHKEIYGNLFVRTLRKPLSHIQSEHEEISSILKEIQVLTNNYNFPENACTNHQVVFRKLHEFHNDMVQHKHLENNILFPRAIELERELLQW